MRATSYKQSNYIITPAKVLSDSEVESLRALCTRYMSIPRERRNATLILVAMECGLRASEVLGITIKDLDFDSKTVFIRSLKGSNARLLPLRPALVKSIETMLKEKYDVSSIAEIPSDTKIFDVSYTRLEQIWRMMRPNPTKTLHSLRHTFAVVTYLKTKDIKLLQNALGHRSINNTLVYVDYCYAQNTLRSALVWGK